MFRFSLCKTLRNVCFSLKMESFFLPNFKIPHGQTRWSSFYRSSWLWRQSPSLTADLLRWVVRQDYISAVIVVCFSHTNNTLIINDCSTVRKDIRAVLNEFDPTELSLHLFIPYHRFCGVRWTSFWSIARGSPFIFSLWVKGLFFLNGNSAWALKVKLCSLLLLKLSPLIKNLQQGTQLMTLSMMHEAGPNLVALPHLQESYSMNWRMIFLSLKQADGTGWLNRNWDIEAI